MNVDDREYRLMLGDALYELRKTKEMIVDANKIMQSIDVQTQNIMKEINYYKLLVDRLNKDSR